MIAHYHQINLQTHQQSKREQILSREQLPEGVICFPPVSPGNSLHSLSEVMFWNQLFEPDKSECSFPPSLEGTWTWSLNGSLWAFNSLLNNAPRLWRLFEETGDGTKKWLPLHKAPSGQISVLNPPLQKFMGLLRRCKCPEAITVHRGCEPAFSKRVTHSLCDVS